MEWRSRPARSHPGSRRARCVLVTALLVFGALAAVTGSPAVALTAVTTTTAPSACPCTIWTTVSPAPKSVASGTALEVGVRFRSDRAGSISGIRFYKAAGDTGTHTGKLYTGGGVLLASAKFSGESGSGWQEVMFSPAVTIAANTTYVAAYHSSRGGFASTSGFFTTTGVDRPPLHAPRDGQFGANGVYRWGAAGGFPNATFKSSNYWVDVVFTDGSGPATTTTTTRPPATTTTARPPATTTTTRPPATTTTTTTRPPGPTTTTPASTTSGWQDSTSASNLYDPLLGMFGHAVAVGDVNGDGWQDVFVGTFADRSDSAYLVRGEPAPRPTNSCSEGAPGSGPTPPSRPCTAEPRGRCSPTSTATATSTS